jgi:hypothetical protein
VISTGYVTADADDDYRRARRRQAWARFAARLLGGRADLLVFSDVVATLGRAGERELGLRTVPLDTVVGTVGRARDFDHRFRPRASADPRRWRWLDRAARTGEFVGPVELYLVGDRHFVRDGHHRVSVALALGRTTIDAYVTEVLTRS